jgi:hypothetical protein
VSDRLQWVLSLGDRMSDPASKIDKQLGQVRAQLKKLDIAAKENALGKITDPLKKQRAELQLHRDKLMLSKSAMEKHGGAAKFLSERMKAGRESIRDWLLILDPLARGLHFVADRAMEMGKRVVAAVSFKQGSMIGLEAMFGGKGGNDVFERMARMAGQIGKPIEQVVGLARSLAAVGFKQQDLEPMVRLIEDLDALDPGAGDKLATVLRGVKSTGFAGVGDFESLRGTMLSPDKLYEQYSRMSGGPGNRIAGKALVEQLNSAGTGIPPNIFSSMLLGGVLDLEGGKAGSASGRGGQKTQSLIDRVGIQIERMFGRLAGSKGVKAFGGVLENVIKLFNPDSKSGAKTQSALEKLSDALGKVLEPLTGPAGLKRMEDFFDSMAKKTEEVLPGLKNIALLLGFFAGKGLDVVRGAGYLKDFGKDIVGMVTGDLSKGQESEATRRFLGGAFGSPPAARRAARDVNVTVHVDARGASKDDADHIAEKMKGAAIDAVSDALDQAATQQGAQP